MEVSVREVNYLMVALQRSSPMMTPKSAKSSRAMEIMAATSIAQDNGFHMYPRNRRKGLTVDSGSLFGPYCSSRLVCSAVVRPLSLHCSKCNQNKLLEVAS